MPKAGTRSKYSLFAGQCVTNATFDAASAAQSVGCGEKQYVSDCTSQPGAGSPMSIVFAADCSSALPGQLAPHAIALRNPTRPNTSPAQGIHLIVISLKYCSRRT